MKTALMIGALIGATVLAYRNTVPGQFIYDDRAIVVHNPLIRDLRHISLILGTSYWGTHFIQPKEYRGGLYRPLTVMTLALNYWFGGLNPRGYHLTNLALHLGVSLLLGFLGLRLGMTWRGAYTAAFLFALLPVHTEAVSNVVGRSEILAAFFVLLAWVFWTGKTRPLAVGLGAASFALALLSKENAAAFLLVLFISDYVTYKKPWKALFQERLIVWVACAGTLFLYFEWKYFVLGTVANVGGIPYFTSQNFLTIGLTMAKFVVEHYLKPLILGISLCADYTRPSLPDARLQDPLAWAYVFLLLGILAVSFIAALNYKNRIGLFSAIVPLFLLPVLNLFAPLEVIGAERFLYLPSIGYCLGLGLFFESWMLSPKSRDHAVLVLWLALFWYGWRTFERNKVWETEESFWTTAVHEAPQSPRAWNGMGFVLMNQKKYEEAIVLFRKSLDLNPLLTDALYNMATVHFLQHRYDLAKDEYHQVLNEKPYDPDTLFHLATIHDLEHDFKAEARDYAALLAADPLDQAAQRGVAILHGKMEQE